MGPILNTLTFHYLLGVSYEEGSKYEHGLTVINPMLNMFRYLLGVPYDGVSKFDQYVLRFNSD